MVELTPEDSQEQLMTLEGQEVRVTSYRLGERYAARVDNIDPGATIGRGRGATRADAEAAAVNGAAVKLGIGAGRDALRASLQHLGVGKGTKGSSR